MVKTCLFVTNISELLIQIIVTIKSSMSFVHDTLTTSSTHFQLSRYCEADTSEYLENIGKMLSSYLSVTNNYMKVHVAEVLIYIPFYKALTLPI